jgi:hypothetical protein
MSLVAILIAGTCACLGYFLWRHPRTPDNQAAHLERHRFAQVAIASGQEGPIEITGRVVASGRPIAAPLSGQPCVYYEVVLSRLGPVLAEARGPRTVQEFELDDGTGRALVRVPPPGPEPPMGDRPEREVLVSLPGSLTVKRSFVGPTPALDRLLADPAYPPRGADAMTAAVEGVIVDGDKITVAGFAHLELMASRQSADHRSPPQGLVITTERGYPLLLIKS